MPAIAAHSRRAIKFTFHRELARRGAISRRDPKLIVLAAIRRSKYDAVIAGPGQARTAVLTAFSDLARTRGIADRNHPDMSGGFLLHRNQLAGVTVEANTMVNGSGHL